MSSMLGPHTFARNLHKHMLHLLLEVEFHILVLSLSKVYFITMMICYTNAQSIQCESFTIIWYCTLWSFYRQFNYSSTNISLVLLSVWVQRLCEDFVVFDILLSPVIEWLTYVSCTLHLCIPTLLSSVQEESFVGQYHHPMMLLSYKFCLKLGLFNNLLPYMYMVQYKHIIMY